MQRWNDLGEVPSGFGPSVLTIGNFDGVHRGHQAVLGRLVAAARAQDAAAVAVTFFPHPLAVLHPEHAPATLSTLEHRLELLATTGLDAVLVMEFTRELASWSPERFVRDVLVDALHARAVVVGRDMRFGHRNSGDVGTLRELGLRYGFAVELVEDLGLADPEAAGAVPPREGRVHSGRQQADGAHASGRRWSSTWVRDAVAVGDVTLAAEVLGRPHRVTGTVVHGDHRGRELGYPTANLSPDSVGLVPADGVYAGRLLRHDPVDGRGRPVPDTDRVLPAAVSVGTNPTFDGTQRRVEAYVLDRDDLDLYGERVSVEFVRRLRPTLRYDGIESLVRQMALDVEEARGVLGADAPARHR